MDLKFQKREPEIDRAQINREGMHKKARVESHENRAEIRVVAYGARDKVYSLKPDKLTTY